MVKMLEGIKSVTSVNINLTVAELAIIVSVLGEKKSAIVPFNLFNDLSDILSEVIEDDY